jgi:transcriptional regulator with XRE-family HTH domain
VAVSSDDDVTAMTDLGQRLRRLRRAQDRTLKEIAQKVGYSEAYLSQVETGRASPSLASLKKIADGYGIPVVDLFSDERPHDQHLVLRRRDRRELAVGNRSVVKELLVARQGGKKMEPICVTIAPGGGSKGAYDHAGEEFGLVLAGSLELTVENQVFLVQKGDTFYFSSTRLHGFRNPSRRHRAVVLWVITPPSF